MISLVAAVVLAAPAYDILTLPRPAEGTYVKYLLNGQRVGTGFDRLALGTFESKPAMEWTTEIDMRMTAGKEKLTRNLRFVKYFEPVAGGRLLGFKAWTDNATASGRLVGGAFELTTADGVRTIPAPKERLEVADLPRLAAFQRKRVKGSSFDVGELRETEIEYSLVSDTAAGTDRRITVKGTDFTLTYDQRGNLISGLNGPIEVLPRVEGDDATEATFDTGAIGIRLYLPIDANAQRLVFLFSGLKRDTVLNVPRRQTAGVAAEGRVRIEVVRTEPALPQKISARWATQPDLEAAFESTEAIDVAALAPFALKTAGGETNAWAVTLLLGKAVKNAVRYDVAAAPDKASVTLKRGRGNAVDRNNVFLALARANGIPARKVEGLCAFFPSRQLFPMTWAEVFVGEWVPYNIDHPDGVAPAHCIALESVPISGGIKVEVE